MIDAKNAKKLCGALLRMPMAPKESTAIRQRVDALAGHARSDGHAERVIDHIVATSSFFPTVREIVDTCEYLPDDTAFRDVRIKCRYCQGDGFATLDQPYGLSCAYPCDHTGRVPANIGLRLSASLRAHYMANERTGAESKARYARRMPDEVRG